MPEIKFSIGDLLVPKFGLRIELYDASNHNKLEKDLNFIFKTGNKDPVIAVGDSFHNSAIFAGTIRLGINSNIRKIYHKFMIGHTIAYLMPDHVNILFEKA